MVATYRLVLHLDLLLLSTKTRKISKRLPREPRSCWHGEPPPTHCASSGSRPPRSEIDEDPTNPPLSAPSIRTGGKQHCQPVYYDEKSFFFFFKKVAIISGVESFPDGDERKRCGTKHQQGLYKKRAFWRKKRIEKDEEKRSGSIESRGQRSCAVGKLWLKQMTLSFSLYERMM